jgi:hypothetical protein
VASPTRNKAAVLASLVSKGWCSLRQATLLLDLSYPSVLKYAELKYIDTLPVGEDRRIYLDEILRFRKFGNLPTDPEELERQMKWVEGLDSSSIPPIQSPQDLLEPPEPLAEETPDAT